MAFLLSDYRWAAVGLAFLPLVWVAGRSFGTDVDRSPGGTALVAVVTSFVWQLPGLQGSLRYLSDNILQWTAYDGMTDLQDFLMETWHTVSMPVLSVVPAGSWCSLSSVR